MRYLVLFLLPLIGLTACVEKQELFEMAVLIENGNESEVFLGKAAGRINDQGAFVMVSRQGVYCEGVYLMSSPSEGSAIARCDDGRKGDFVIGSKGRVAQISGTIDGEPFTGGAVDSQMVAEALAQVSR